MTLPEDTNFTAEAAETAVVIPCRKQKGLSGVFAVEPP
jgi:hypothetical protein